jgi:hypothetical protein
MLIVCDKFRQELMWVMLNGIFNEKECTVTLVEKMVRVNWRLIEDNLIFEIVYQICELIVNSCGGVFVNGLAVLYEVLDIEQKIGTAKLRNYLLENGLVEVLDRVMEELDSRMVPDLMRFFAPLE